MSSGEKSIVASHIVTNVEQLYSCQKSCYTPVDILSVLKETKQYSSIAIVGLPCHIQGSRILENILKKFSNIKYRIGLICEGILCEEAQSTLLSYYKNKGNVKIDWKRKNFTIGNIYYPYKSAPIVIYDDNGQECILPNTFRFILKKLFIPPRCRVCYDKLNTHADIVLGDPWGMSNVDWKQGSSVIITRTEIGKELLENLYKQNYVTLQEANINELIKGQLIEARKKTVSYYSEALDILPIKIDSYLYYQQDGTISSIDVNKAQKELKQFMKLEEMSSNNIILLARQKIRQTLLRQKIKQLFIYKILQKFKFILRK